MRKKIQVILMTLLFCCLSTSVYSQKITFNISNTTVKEAIELLKEKTGYSFVYEANDLDTKKIISVSAHNKPIEEVLKQILQKQDVVCEIKGKNIIVSKRNVIKNPSTQKFQNISGVVQDQNGEPVIGASVFIKDTKKGTVTDISGKFSFEDIGSAATIVISYIGYKTQQIGIEGKTLLEVKLVDDNKYLDELVVVGYGVMKKRDVTGSISSVKTNDITALPTSNVLESMQGKISGLDMTRQSGQVGSAFNFTIRGNRSLTASNSPLILVDGMTYGSNVDINPNDVASIEVLKDASSTAIYGSRGANGVIIITTKKGSAGKAKVEFNMYSGVNEITNYPTLCNTSQYVAMKREAYRATGSWNSPADDSKLWTSGELDRINSGTSTNWYDVIYSNGIVNDYQVSVTGGTGDTKVAFSLDYYNETGTLKNEDMNRYNGRFNFSQKIRKNVEVGASLLYTYSNANARRSDIFDQTQKMVPIGIAYETDGSVKKYPFASGTDINPLVDEDKNNYRNETLSSRTFGSSYLNFDITKNLLFRSNFGIDAQSSRNGLFEGSNSTAHDKNSGYSRAAKLEKRFTGLTWDNTLTFMKDINVHSFTAMVGQSVQSSSNETTYAEGKQLAFEQSLFHNLDGTQRDYIISSDLIESSLLSYFGRLNYKLMDKYILTLTLRADGSSVLSEKNRWGYFPSAALAWRLKDEKFFASKSYISDLKARLSYGLSGNSAVSPYQTQGELSKTIYAFNEGAAYGYKPSSLANKDLTWEKTKVLNFGLDFGFFNNRIYGVVDVYKSWTSDLLMTMLIPGHSGFTSMIANVGKTETSGVDISLSSVNIKNKNFSWTTDLTFSANKEKITALNTDQDDVSNSWFIGSPTQVFYDYEKIGIWQTSEATNAAKYGQVPGDIKVKDLNDDGVIDAKSDRRVLGQRTPKWTAGLNNHFNYKGLELSVFLYTRIGQLIKSEAAQHFRPSAYVNSAVVDYWTPENATNAYPRPIASKSESSMLYYSTLGYRKGNFMKIKDITLGYSLPNTIIRSTGLSKVRVYCTAKNFFTFSEFNDYDPERGGSSSYPMTKQLVFGANVSF